MIKALILLPIRILGLVFMAIGGAIDARQRRAAQAERARIAQAKEEQRAMERGARIAAARAKEAERKRAAQARADEASRRRAEADRRREAKQTEAERVKAAKAAERVREADNDLAHLEQRQRDLATLYSFAESEYTNASTDRKKEAAFRKMMAIDQQRRTAARQAERLQYTISTGGR